MLCACLSHDIVPSRSPSGSPWVEEEVLCVLMFIAWAFALCAYLLTRYVVAALEPYGGWHWHCLCGPPRATGSFRSCRCKPPSNAVGVPGFQLEDHSKEIGAEKINKSGKNNTSGTGMAAEEEHSIRDLAVLTRSGLLKPTSAKIREPQEFLPPSTDPPNSV